MKTAVASWPFEEMEHHQPPHHCNQNLSFSQHFTNPQLFSLGQQHNTTAQHHHQPQHQQPQQQQQQHHHQPQHNQTLVPQFLDSSQHLVAHFSQHAPTLTTGHFAADSLGVNDASQFTVSVMQQQQNPQHQDAASFSPAAFFQQHHSNLSSHHHNDQDHLNHNPNRNHHQPPHQVHHQQSHTCISMMNTNANETDNFALLGQSHVLMNPTSNSLLRLQNGCGAVANDQVTIAVRNIVDIRQPPRANLANLASGSASESNCNSARNHLPDHNSHNVTRLAASNGNNGASQINSSNHSSNHSSNLTSDDNYNSHNIDDSKEISTVDIGIITNNHRSSNHQKCKSNGTSKKDKSCSQRSSGSPRRTFACPICEKGFTEKFNMKRHMQIHSQSRPKYICNECSKSFAWKDNFIRHRKAAHRTSLPQYPV